MELNATIFVQIFIFLTLLLWLSRSLFAPILKLFEEREKRIVGAKVEASELSARADDKAKAFSDAFELARDNARQTLSQLKHAMEKEHNEILDKTKSIARDRLDRAQKELMEEENAIRLELAGASSAITEQVIATMTRQRA